jgi:hypothetical protein
MRAAARRTAATVERAQKAGRRNRQRVLHNHEKGRHAVHRAQSALA